MTAMSTGGEHRRNELAELDQAAGQWEQLLTGALTTAGYPDPDALVRTIADEMPVDVATPAAAQLLAERHHRLAAAYAGLAAGLGRS